MRSVKITISKRINNLYNQKTAKNSFRFVLFAVSFLGFNSLFAQDNSPYTRYGIGDLVPSTNIVTRGMGSISAGYNNLLSINFSNPASYGSFQSYIEQKSKKQQYGRAILDMGLNIESRTLSEPNNLARFTASNALFSYLQVGIPLKRNWGLSFGLRPISRVSYKIATRELLPGIDSAATLNTGDGGTNLASIGTGYRFQIGKQTLSIGANGGYLFGRKDYSARRTLINDSLAYNNGNFETSTHFGSLYYNAGLQYRIPFGNDRYSLTLGMFGNWEQDLRATQELIRETFYFNEANGNVTLDSVFHSTTKGQIIYPASYTAGFVIEKAPTDKEGGWLVGVDYSKSKWGDYRYFGQKDQLRDKWDFRVGAELRPTPSRNYFSNVSYRAGFFTGPDYVQVQAGSKIPVIGGSVGFGLPVKNYNRLSQLSATIFNIAFEYSKRGNNESLLKENLFRMSLGFSLSDLWFARKKYE